MSKKAQALMISLWVLVILTILAVGIGHRVSMALRISAHQKDGLKALYLAKAGLNRAIVEIDNDTNSYDAPDDRWANNEAVFKKITLNDFQNEFASVSYQVLDENNIPSIIYGARDEESKININTASRELLLALLEKRGINAADNVVNNILVWRGDIPDDNKIYESLGYSCKAAPFTNFAELSLIKDITAEDYQKIQGLITVFGKGSININTVSPEILTIFCRGIAKKIGAAENFADSVTGKIIELRDNLGPFKEKNGIIITPTGAEEANIFNNLMNSVVLQSDYFLIEVIGNSGKIKRKISSVYCRKDKRIVYWHEN